VVPQGVILGLAASAFPGNWIEMQILQLHLRSTTSEIPGSLFKGFQVLLMRV
jgi:hypothetical protein